MLKIVIVHHHLRRGGVTRVIENALQSLQGTDTKIVVLSGEPAAKGVEIPKVKVIDGLRYSGDAPATTPDKLARLMVEKAKEALDGHTPDLFHFHNHSLGKNPTVTATVQQLQQAGYPLLLQLHDFAEDGRPANYARLRDHLGKQLEHTLYPTGDNILYATLNGRDRAILAQAATDTTTVATLPNPISLPTLQGNPDALRAHYQNRELILYPTRAIRRKNVGEFLLWAALKKDEAHFATTLEPENPEWQAAHRQWEQFAHEKKLPVTLAAVAKGPHTFDDWMLGAHSIITTSIAEGFGLAFLEPTLIRKQIVGRNLPDITTDFNSIHLDHLYNHLYSPLNKQQKETLRTTLQSKLSQSFTHYGTALPEDAAQTAWEAITDEHGRVDFAYLDEKLQQELISSLLSGDLSPQDFTPYQLPAQPPETITTSRETVIKQFSRETYGQRLLTHYQQLAKAGNTKPGPAIPASAVLKGYLHPRRFCLLRT